MPGIVDPRPHQEAALRAWRDALDAATTDAERERIQHEIDELERDLHRPFWSRFLFGRHRSVPW